MLCVFRAGGTQGTCANSWGSRSVAACGVARLSSSCTPREKNCAPEPHSQHHNSGNLISVGQVCSLTGVSDGQDCTAKAAQACNMFSRKEILGERDCRPVSIMPRQSAQHPGLATIVALHPCEVLQLRRSGPSKSELARRFNIGRASERRVFAATPKKK